MAPRARVQWRAALVSSPPEKARPIFWPLGRCWRMVAVGTGVCSERVRTAREHGRGRKVRDDDRDGPASPGRERFYAVERWLGGCRGLECRVAVHEPPPHPVVDCERMYYFGSAG